MSYGNERAGRFQTRYGLTLGEAGGINTESDPAAIGPDQYQSLVNAEHKGNRIKNRDGLAKVNSSAAMTGSVLGIADDRAMGIGGGGLAGVGVRWYFIGLNGMNSYDTGLSTPLELLADTPYPVPAGGTPCAFVFFDDGWVYFANYSLDSGNAYLYRFRPGVVTGPSDTVGSVQAQPEKVVIVDSDGSTSSFLTSMVKCGPYYYLGTGHYLGSDLVNTTTVYRWDGKTLTSEDSAATTDGAYMAQLFAYRDRPVVMRSYESAGEPTFKYKADSGTWTALTWPTAATPFQANAACEFKDKLWLAGVTSVANSGSIYSVSGTTIAEERVITTTLTSGSGFGGLAVSSGYMYFSYYKDGAGLYIGRYDGTTWTNEYKLVTASALNAGPLWVQGGRMYAFSDGGAVYSAALGSLNGSWSLATTLTCGFSFNYGSYANVGGYQVVATV